MKTFLISKEMTVSVTDEKMTQYFLKHPLADYF